MSIKLKICGMREPDNILEVGELEPDLMGFIFYDRSPRCVPAGFMLPSGLRKSIRKVGVFVNEGFDEITNKVRTHSLDFVQLHGNEPVTLSEKLKETGVGVIKAFSIDQHFDFDELNPYKGVVDFFLFDTKGKFYGGNASTFDWSLLNQYDQEVPFFLSGGVSSENVHDIAKLKGMNIHGVDINSSVEIQPGLKDIDAINDFLNILNSKF